ncbi:MAG: metallophosphoesterase family protein [Deltaproteobacteria bacterium]|nr:metallophosphoesterase family protein [Deltaproteobacteria bacterium]
MRGTSALIACALAVPSLAGAEILRGPYVQNVSRTEVTVMWATDVAEIGTVDFGPDTDYGSQTADAWATTEHRVRLVGLAPGARTYYRVTSGDIVVGDDETFVDTMTDTCEPFRFVAYGDTRGLLFGQELSRHADVVTLVDQTMAPDFVLATGDMVQHGEQDDLWLAWFESGQAMFRHTVLFPTIGNHDYENEDDPAADDAGLMNWYRVFDLPAADGESQRSYFSFSWGTVAFIVLDRYQGFDEGSPQLAWLEQSLEASRADEHVRHIVVSVHPPPEGVAWFGPDETLRALEPLFAEFDVGLVLGGHEHSYQRVVKDGITYVVTGGGGAPLDGLTDFGGVGCDLVVHGNDGLQAVNTCTYHAVQLDVAGETIDARAIDLDGEVLDEFTIEPIAGKPVDCSDEPADPDAGVDGGARPDAGASEPDAGSPDDAGARADGGTADDGGALESPSEQGGCGCNAPGAGGSSLVLLLAVIAGLGAPRRVERALGGWRPKAK